MPSGDFKLDAQLKAVTVPSGLLKRLLALPYADDAGLDDAVREVELPEGFQRSEFLLEHGALDMIIDRRELRDRISAMLRLLTGKEPAAA